jgi:IPT/TIG domain-containing protein
MRPLLCVLTCAWFGCGGAGARTLVEPRGVPESSGAPSLARVVDVGELAGLPAIGQSLPRLDSDGKFEVGELVLIEGSDFGRQPTINIGGRPAAVLARTGSGAILARIPTGVPTGAVEVEVSHPGGRGTRGIDVRRHAVVALRDAVHVLSVGADGAVALTATLPLPGARDVAISSDGSVVYVVADAAGGEPARLAVISLVSGGGPHLVRSLRLPGTRVRRVVTAEGAALGVAVVPGHLVPFETSTPSQPALYDPVALDGDDAVVAAALHPQGRSLGLLLADNRLRLVEVGRPDAAVVGDPIELLPGERVPLARDLGWSPAGDELWVLTGDGAASLAVGQHPPRLLRVAVDGGPSVRGQVEVVGVDAPTALAVAHRESIQAGTAIRSTARKAALVVASVERELLKPGGVGKAMATPHPFGQLVRTDLEGQGQSIWIGESLVGDVELTEDVEYVLAVAARVVPGKAGWEIGVDVVPLAGGAGHRVVLGSVAGEAPPPAAIAASP